MNDQQQQLLMGAIAVLAIVVLAGVAIRVGQVSRVVQPNGRVVVRCRDGHVFTTLWVPGISVKAIRLGLVRYQWCPVGEHRSFVSPVPPGQLTDLERHQAAMFDDGNVP